MQWIELSLGCGPDHVQGIVTLLEKYGQGGAAVEEWEEGDSFRKHYLVKIYLPLSRAYRSVRAEIDARLSQSGFQQPLREKVLLQDEWFDSLKKNFKVIQIGEHFVVKPSWITEKLDYAGRIIIEMDPGAAFGTGLHPTTRLCLLNLDRYLKSGMRVFDLGTGTGILAIAAVKLGASEVVACDIDAVAVKTARANAGINQVSDSIQFRRGTLSVTARSHWRGSFDVVLANITSRAISDLSTAIAAILKPGGILITSGIHPDGLDEVLIRLSLAELDLIRIDQEEQWYAVMASRPNH